MTKCRSDYLEAVRDALWRLRDEVWELRLSRTLKWEEAKKLLDLANEALYNLTMGRAARRPPPAYEDKHIDEIIRKMRAHKGGWE